jgi:hypothetical protein
MRKTSLDSTIKMGKNLMETGNWRVDVKALALLFFIPIQADSTG